MTEITNGPWVAELAWIDGEFRPSVFFIPRPEYRARETIASCDWNHQPQEVQMANARAIAAVPDMLETLEWILDGGWNDGPGSWAILERRVEAVIAKARGEA